MNSLEAITNLSPLLESSIKKASSNSEQILTILRTPTQDFRTSIFYAILVACVTAFLTFLFSSFLYFIKESNRKIDIRNALKSEIFSNSHEFIDLIRVAEKCKKRAIPPYEYPLLSIVYSEPRFIAFNSMINNALFGAINTSKNEVSMLYAIFREYDLVIKGKLGTIEQILKDYSLKDMKIMTAAEIKRFAEEGCPAYIYYCDEIIRWATSFKTYYYKTFMKKVMFMKEKEWVSFQEAMKLK